MRLGLFLCDHFKSFFSSGSILQMMFAVLSAMYNLVLILYIHRNTIVLLCLSVAGCLPSGGMPAQRASCRAAGPRRGARPKFIFWDTSQLFARR